MKLSRQLLLLSLLTLLIPWAGYQHLIEVDSLLRQGQGQALEANARAQAARIEAQPALLEQLALAGAQAQGFYAPLSPGAIVVDGYGGDWPAKRGYYYKDQDGDFSAQWQLALGRAEAESFHNRQRQRLKRDTLYLWLEVSKAELVYFHPGRPGLINGDHIRLRLGQRLLALGSSAPGLLQARYQSADGVKLEHRVNGHWRERKDGFQLELSLPMAMAKAGFNLNIVAADGRWLGLQHWDLPAQPPIYQRAELDQALAQAQQAELQLAVFSGDGQLLGASEPTPAWDYIGLHPVKAWLYQRLLARQQLPTAQPWRRQGKLDSIELGSALGGQSQSRWYRQGGQGLLRSAAPIRNGQGQLVGAVIAEQDNSIHIGLMNSALVQLILVSGLASLLAGGGLLAYASWLSWRVRRLSLAADRALDEQGRVELSALPASRAGDEIGDLSRSFQQLLQRLHAYTEYLRSLSSKLSHELRTPLAVVRTSLDNLSQGPLPESAQVYAERAAAGSERLSAILNAMGAASQVEAAIAGAELERLDLAQLLSDLAGAYGDTFKDRCQVELQLQIPGPCPIVAAGELLAQALDKLVENAADFCPPGGRIYLRLNELQGHYCVEVDNDGPLLPAKMQAQLFDSLVSLREPSAKQGADERPHLGLGLYIVQLIAELHRAQISAHNRADGSGVIFRLMLHKALT